MRAIFLAAGRGLCLQQANGWQRPKWLLPLSGMNLLERHLGMRKSVGVEDVDLALAHRQHIEAELDHLRRQPRPGTLLNARCELGNVLRAAHAVLPQLRPISVCQ